MTSDLPPFVPTSDFKITASPNPGWTYGQPIESTPNGRAWADGEKLGWKSIDVSKEETRKLYGTMISGITPRPVAFVSSISEDGIENLAPFSWFNQVSASPPVISISCHGTHVSGAAKDTLLNIRATKGFTVNIISEPWIRQADACNIDTPPHISEWPISGLTKSPSVLVKAPRVRESAFSMECELLQDIDILHPDTQDVTTTLVLGTVKFIHIRNDVIDPGRGTVDSGKLKPIMRMGGITYAKISEGYMLPRESWADKENDIREALGGRLDDVNT
ncbi:hypothetical protein B0H34DRAFT_16391 [Crassisporium funariophilum]|nr:hypothetical protein B0H34DRAFT_16391 [Crassisporium funariophilum]